MTATLAVVAIALGLATAGPTEDQIPAGCDAACEKVTDMTAGRWPAGRKGTQEAKDAFEKMRKDVFAQCKSDCARRGRPFVNCIKVAKDVQRVSKCYQLAKPPKTKAKKRKAGR